MALASSLAAVLSVATMIAECGFATVQCSAAEVEVTKLPISKNISRKELEKYKSISVNVEEDGKQAKYEGVPLRTLLSDLLPGYNLDAMPEVKKLAREELVLEVSGYDNYPGIVTALEVAMNHSGDRFLLATHKDGKEIDPGVQLICKLDEMHTRWVHQVVRLRIVAVPKSSEK